MASTTFLPPDEPAVVDMAAFGRDLVRRRAVAGEPNPPRNAGNRRTPSKKALLSKIEDAGGRW